MHFLPSGVHQSALPAEAPAARVPAHWARLAERDVREEAEWDPGRRDGSREDHSNHIRAGPSGL